MDSASTGPIHVGIDLGATDATVVLDIYMDPILCVYLKHAGRVSKRRLLNMARMRFKEHLRYAADHGMIAEDRVNPKVRELTYHILRMYVRSRLEPSYSVQGPEDPFPHRLF